METPFDENDCIPELPVGGYLAMNDGTRLLIGDVNKRGGRCDCCGIDYAAVDHIEPLEQGASADEPPQAETESTAPEICRPGDSSPPGPVSEHRKS